MSGVAISIRFLAGRFEATLWDRHPNEGIAEWPPAPWRVLRAIAAAAFRADGDPNRTLLARVLHALRSVPRYHLPPVTQAHSRSYQPLYGTNLQSGRQETVLVLDPFVIVGRGAGQEDAVITLEWPDADIDAQARAALDRWLAALGYLGRAESWVEARLAPVPVGTASASSEAEQWVAAMHVRLLAAAESDADALLRAVLTGTDMLFKEKVALPPHTRWATIGFRERPYVAPPLRATGRRPQSEHPTLVRLALGGRVRPRLVDAVRFGDRVRSALMSCSRGADGLPHPVFAGKSADGTPLATNVHAHVLPLDEDRDGAIDHVLLWAPGGFDSAAQDAIFGFTWLWGDDGFDLRVVLTGTARRGGDLDQLGVPREWRGRHAAATARVWTSRTPFVLPRHPKVRAGVVRDGAEEQLRRELLRLGLSEVDSIRSTRGTDAPAATAWHRFRLARLAGGGSRGGDRGYGFEIVFAEQVCGPLAVGYGARQGLGQFEPADD